MPPAPIASPISLPDAAVPLIAGSSRRSVFELAINLSDAIAEFELHQSESADLDLDLGAQDEQLGGDRENATIVESSEQIKERLMLLKAAYAKAEEALVLILVELTERLI